METDKEFLEKLCKKYYGNKPKEAVILGESNSGKPKGQCSSCGKVRVLGQRGTARNKCSKCRKGE